MIALSDKEMDTALNKEIVRLRAAKEALKDRVEQEKQRAIRAAGGISQLCKRCQPLSISRTISALTTTVATRPTVLPERAPRVRSPQSRIEGELNVTSAALLKGNASLIL